MFLIYISLLVSNFCIIIFSSEVGWALLVILIIWDMIAVLTPCGPLNLLIKLLKSRQKQNEKVFLPPVMIYNTVIFNSIINEQDMQQTSNKTIHDSDTDDETNSPYRPSLGMGDFIFYSLLVGMVRQGHTLITVVTSILNILVGLLATMICLIWFNRALPALPISLTISIINVAIFTYCAEPFAKHLNANLIFI